MPEINDNSFPRVGHRGIHSDLLRTVDEIRGYYLRPIGFMYMPKNM
jgi:hypothetical protein